MNPLSFLYKKSWKRENYILCALGISVCLIIIIRWFYKVTQITDHNSFNTNKKIIELFENATSANTMSVELSKQIIDEPKLTTPIPILVIASTDNQDYIDFINHYWIPLLLWLEKHRTSELNVYIYLIFGAGNSFEKVPIPEEIHKYFLVFEDIPETYTPGILQKTVRGFEEMNTKHPDYEILYRTNISTFLLLDRIIDRMNTVIAQNGHGKNNIYWGMQGYAPEEYNGHKLDTNIRLVSGMDIMISHDVVQFIIDNKNKLNYDIIDDVEIGRFLHYNKNIIGALPIEHRIWKCKPKDIHMDDYLNEILNDINKNKIYMNIRLRCYDENNTRHPDTEVMKFIFNNYYR